MRTRANRRTMRMCATQRDIPTTAIEPAHNSSLRLAFRPNISVVGATGDYGLLRSSSLEYFVPCRVAGPARPVLVIWYTHTRGATVAAPEYAPPSWPTLAAASARPEASQPESTNFASDSGVSHAKLTR